MKKMHPWEELSIRTHLAIQEALDVNENLAKEILSFTMKAQVFSKKSKNEATHIYDATIYVLYKKGVWQQVWEKVQIKSKVEFSYTNTSIGESRKARNRINSGKIFFSSKTKRIIGFDSKDVAWDKINLPENLGEVASWSEECLQNVKVPPSVKVILARRRYDFEKNCVTVTREKFVPDETVQLQIPEINLANFFDTL